MQERVGAACAELESNQCASLDLTGSKLGHLDDRLIHTLVPFLRHCSSVTSLNLSLNRISDEGVAALARALGGSTNCNIAALNISANPRVTDVGVEQLVGSLPPSVTALDVSGCTLTAKSMEAIVAKLTLPSDARGRISLCTVEARDVQLVGDEVWGTADRLAPLAQYLCSPTCTLSSLHLSGNCFSDACVPAVVAVVQRNKSLTAFSVANSAYITDYHPLAKAVESNGQLVIFPLGSDGKKTEFVNVEPKLRDNRRQRAAAADAQKIAAIEAVHEITVRKLRRAHEDDVRALQEQIAILQAEGVHWKEQATLAMAAVSQPTAAADAANKAADADVPSPEAEQQQDREDGAAAEGQIDSEL